MSSDFSVDAGPESVPMAAAEAPPPAEASPEQPSAEDFMPGETAGPQQLDDGSVDLGVIAAAAPEGINLDAGLVNTMGDKMAALGLSEQQIAGVVREYINTQTGAYDTRFSQSEQSRESCIKDLQNAWGTSFDSHVSDAHFALQTAAGSAQAAKDIAGIELADGGVLGDHPDIIKLFAALGSRMERPSPGGANPAQSGGNFISAVSAQEQRDALADDPEFMQAWSQGGHPAHARAVKRMNDLTAAIG